MSDAAKEIITNLHKQSMATLPRIEVAIQEKQAELAQLYQQRQQITTDIEQLDASLKELETKKVE